MSAAGSCALPLVYLSKHRLTQALVESAADPAALEPPAPELSALPALRLRRLLASYARCRRTHDGHVT